MLFKKNILVFILLWVTLFASAYDAVGHRIIADIAYNNLTKKARKQCDKVLGTHGIIYYATWADDVRSDKAYDYSYKWHYQNLKDSMSAGDLQKLLNDPTAEGEHLFFAIGQMKDRLKKDPNDAEALKFLVHFIGDLHQPMHLGRVEDLGGNKLSINWFGRKTNVHAVWDGQIIDSKKMSYSEFSKYLQDKYAKRRTEFKKYTILQSIETGYKIRNEIYAYDYSDTNNYYYVYRFADELDEMLYRAGIQLANTLNEVCK
ncbi:MAG: S1/P1 nuclease [Paludibacter sp.]|nr:S1/P1 nuclease [Paludibacter sp.]